MTTGEKLIIEKLPGGCFTLRLGDRFISQLCWDEMIGVVARYTDRGFAGYGGFLTYEQWAKKFPWTREVTPVALIEYQGEAA